MEQPAALGQVAVPVSLSLRALTSRSMTSSTSTEHTFIVIIFIIIIMRAWRRIARHLVGHCAIVLFFVLLLLLLLRG